MAVDRFLSADGGAVDDVLISELNLDASVATLLGGMAMDMLNPFLASDLL